MPIQLQIKWLQFLSVLFAVLLIILLFGVEFQHFVAKARERNHKKGRREEERRAKDGEEVEQERKGKSRATVSSKSRRLRSCVMAII